MRKSVAVILVMAMFMSVSGCKDTSKESVAKEKTYTYNARIEAMPVDFNPHTTEGNTDNIVNNYSQMGLVEAIRGEDGKLTWVYEMADSITDVTASVQDKGKYKIAEDETGRVWQIKLNKGAAWEDGVAINADTYLNSMKLLLDLNEDNSEAKVYIDGKSSKIAIYNADMYSNNDLTGQPIYSLIFDSKSKTYAIGVEEVENMYVSIVNPTPFWGYSLKDAYYGYGSEYFTDADGTDYYKIIEKAVGNNEYVLVNDEILSALKGICKVVGGGHEEEFMEMLFYKSGTYGEIDFSEVGLVKVDEYTFNYVTTSSVSQDEFFEAMLNNWIVNEELYISSISTEGENTTVAYGTGIDTYKSYGPYKLSKIEKDKIYMEKNENWYGYTDGKHEGQYQTTDIVVHIVEDDAKAEQMFLSGKLDELALDKNLVINYVNSDRIYTVINTGTFRWIFASDMDKLFAMEKDLNDGTNKRVIGYDDFRKALSYSIDRVRLCLAATPNYVPAVYLLSNAYTIDGSYNAAASYRNTAEGKNALVNMYGLTFGNGETYKTLDEAYNTITGYDEAKAKELFTAVYDKAISEGNYTEGQLIKLRCVVSEDSKLTLWEEAEEIAINEMIASATKGTGFEGKITVEYVCGTSNRYTDCVEGKVEMIKGAWGGSVVSPFVTIGMYTVSEYAGNIQESCGWDPSAEELKITYDFDGDGEAEEVAKSYRDWTLAMNDSSVYGNDLQARLIILSSLETGILSAYQCIPMYTETSSRVLSYKVEYGYSEYNTIYEYGGLRTMTYNYDDEAFDKYVDEQGSSLKYQ